ncbi:MAG: hypothetical protein J2P23_04200 [Microlunatus sp.]|nr:hypothetical protein [Microlunatus sp.]
MVRERRLVACLAIHGGLTRRHAAEILWPQADIGRRLTSLRTALHALRRRVPDLVVSDESSLRLSESAASDLQELRTAIAGVTARRGHQPIPSDGHRILATTGDLLPGWYDDWVLLERERLRHQRVAALQLLARAALDRRQPRRAVRFATAASEIEPYDDTTEHLLISAQVAIGHLADAVCTYRHYCRRLAEELGVAPAPLVTQLVQEAMITQRRNHARMSADRWSDTRRVGPVQPSRRSA